MHLANVIWRWRTAIQSLLHNVKFWHEITMTFLSCPLTYIWFINLLSIEAKNTLIAIKKHTYRCRLMYWCPLILQRNVIMLDVINKATSISCYFILSMYFIDNIRTFSANIKLIYINFRNRGRVKIVPLPSFSFLFWDEYK